MEEAAAAFGAGDYTWAAQEWREQAELGNPTAQTMLGILYRSGTGVLQNYSEAAIWYRRAAKQGYADAQLSLALMYVFGQGVPQDDVRAYALMNIAATNGSVEATEFRNTTAQVMDPNELMEAQRLSRLWLNDPSLIE